MEVLVDRAYQPHITYNNHTALATIVDSDQLALSVYVMNLFLLIDVYEVNDLFTKNKAIVTKGEILS